MLLCASLARRVRTASLLASKTGEYVRLDAGGARGAHRGADDVYYSHHLAGAGARGAHNGADDVYYSHRLAGAGARGAHRGAVSSSTV